jgi:hypothetical protein
MLAPVPFPLFSPTQPFAIEPASGFRRDMGRASVGPATRCNTTRGVLSSAAALVMLPVCTTAIRA